MYNFSRSHQIAPEYPVRHIRVAQQILFDQLLLASRRLTKLRPVLAVSALHEYIFMRCPKP